jgi:hypothetical protein
VKATIPHSPAGSACAVYHAWCARLKLPTPTCTIRGGLAVAAQLVRSRRTGVTRLRPVLKATPYGDPKLATPRGRAARLGRIGSSRWLGVHAPTGTEVSAPSTTFDSLIAQRRECRLQSKQHSMTMQIRILRANSDSDVAASRTRLLVRSCVCQVWRRCRVVERWDVRAGARAYFGPRPGGWLPGRRHDV